MKQSAAHAWQELFTFFSHFTINRILNIAGRSGHEEFSEGEDGK